MSPVHNYFPLFGQRNDLGCTKAARRAGPGQSFGFSFRGKAQARVPCSWAPKPSEHPAAAALCPSGPQPWPRPSATLSRLRASSHETLLCRFPHACFESSTGNPNSRSQALISREDLNHPDSSWRSGTAKGKPLRQLRECTEDTFLARVMESPAEGEVLLAPVAQKGRRTYWGGQDWRQPGLQ